MSYLFSNISRGKSFRADYLDITWVSAVMNKAALLLLTATCTSVMKTEILSHFGVEDITVVAAVPNRYVRFNVSNDTIF